MFKTCQSHVKLFSAVYFLAVTKDYTFAFNQSIDYGAVRFKPWAFTFFKGKKQPGARRAQRFLNPILG